MPANITILGKIGKDAELKKSDKTGNEWIRFSIASHSISGEKKTTTWFEVISFNTKLLSSVRKGTNVSLTGEFELGDTQQNEEGQFWTPLRVVADRVYIVNDGSSKKQDAPSADECQTVEKAKEQNEKKEKPSPSKEGSKAKWTTG